MMRVVCCGLGGIGTAAALSCMVAEDIELVALVDPAKRGQRLAGLTILEDLDQLARDADVALYSTTSSVGTLTDQIRPALERGMDVVSTCEELAYPWDRHSAVAARLDRDASRNHVTVVAAGVNPGFVMDVVAGLAATATSSVHTLRVTREVDLTPRRPELARKLGLGLTVRAWDEAAGRGDLGHRGLVESALLCAHSLGGEVTSRAFAREPLLRDGVIAGVREIATVACRSGQEIELTLTFALDARDRDAIVVGHTAGELRIELAGLRGDDATVARLIHTAKMAPGMPSGLRTPLEVPVAIRIDDRFKRGDSPSA